MFLKINKTATLVLWLKQRIRKDDELTMLKVTNHCSILNSLQTTGIIRILGSYQLYWQPCKPIKAICLTRINEQALACRLSRNWRATWTLLRWCARFICLWRSIAYKTQLVIWCHDSHNPQWNGFQQDDNIRIGFTFCHLVYQL